MGLRNWLGLEKRAAPQPRPFEEVIQALDRTGVSTETAMYVPTVMACVRCIANGCATPPLNVYQDDAAGRRRIQRNLPIQRLLNRRPNEWQTSLEWRRTMTMHAALTGDALSVKVKVGRNVTELIPVRPGYFQIEKTARYQVMYRVWDEFGLIGNFTADDIFHLPNWQWEEIKGLDAVSLARAAIGLSVNAEKTQAALHENGGRPSGVLSTEQVVSPEAVNRLKDAWASFTNSRRSGTAVLDSGFKYLPISASGVDNQHLETRRFQVEEICRAFDVFPLMIGHSDKTSTFGSSEAFFAAHLKHTLAPWHELWRQRLDEFVIDGRGPLYADFDTRYLSSGSMRDRAVWARTMAELGIYTRNELRDEEGKDALPGLDDPLTPMNMNRNGGNDANQNA
jgi:HK97 family phage portal protein